MISKIFSDIYILRCLLNCYELSAKSEESHWHCPLCPRYNMAKRRVEEHLQSHLRGTWHRMLANMQEEGDMLLMQRFMEYSHYLSPRPGHGRMGCMVLCSTFHTAPEQG